MWNISILVNRSNGTEETWTVDREMLVEVIKDISAVLITEKEATSFIFTLVPPKDN